VANRGDNSVSILLNTTATGANTPTFTPQVDLPYWHWALSVSIGDINGDGKPDLAVANRDSNTVSILLNTTPKVTAVTATTLTAATVSVLLSISPSPSMPLSTSQVAHPNCN
jgi:hypothetical protein